MREGEGVGGRVGGRTHGGRLAEDEMVKAGIGIMAVEGGCGVEICGGGLGEGVEGDGTGETCALGVVIVEALVVLIETDVGEDAGVVCFEGEQAARGDLEVRGSGGGGCAVRDAE